MNKLFPLPAYTLLKTAVINGGCSSEGLLHAAPWILKTTLLEPMRWIELLLHAKKVNNHVVEKPPVFVLGYYRSGTTYLQQYFMQDERLGFMSLYQTIFPELMLTFEKRMTPLLEFSAKLFRAKNPFHRIPLTWHSTGEEDIGMVGMLSPCASTWGYLFPNNYKSYFEKYVLFENISIKEKDDWQNSYNILIKKLSLASKNKQMVLKNPPNTARIKTLLTLFPHAKFIFIHRNPYDVYASTQRMLQMIKRNYMLGKTDNVDFSNIILKSYAGISNAYLRDKHLIPNGHLAELRYEDFIQAPVESLKHLYTTLQLGDFRLCEKKMIAHAEKNKNYIVLNHVLQQDELKTISCHWEPYFKHWNYQLA